MRCLDAKLEGFTMVVGVLDEEHGDLPGDLQLQLPAVEACADTEALREGKDIPVDPWLAQKVKALRGQIDRVNALRCKCERRFLRPTTGLC